jgi:hypothetical protein
MLWFYTTLANWLFNITELWITLSGKVIETLSWLEFQAVNQVVRINFENYQQERKNGQHSTKQQP